MRGLLVFASFLAALLLVPFPAGAAELPAPMGSTERVSGYSLYWHDARVHCGSGDPVLGMASLSPLATLTMTPVPGGTEYALHLESPFASEGCPTLDVAITSPIAPWPTRSVSSAFTLPCGAAGVLTLHGSVDSRSLHVHWDVPEACGFGLSGVLSLSVSVGDPHPSKGIVCVPVSITLPSCTGVSEEDGEPACDNGARPSSSSFGGVVGVARRCDRQDGGDYVVVADPLNVVRLEARADSCTLRVRAPLSGIVDESVPCPREVSDPVHAAPWGRLLP